MRQAAAILLDAYRELNARRMFWVAIAISLLIVMCFLGIGITERGFQILWFEVPSFLNTSVIPAATFYKFIFVMFGINVWLTWGATILALTSTSGMVPELVRSGSIEMVLSRPISRLRLFLLKYLAGLLFVALQVAVFATASFIVIGVRGQSWEWGLFLSIPIVLAFFSYLFSVCVLLGMLTRSSTASLLLTLIFWLIIGGVHIAESAVLAVRINQETRIASVDTDVKTQTLNIEQEEARGNGDKIDGLRRRLESTKNELRERQSDHALAVRWHEALYNTKTLLPKTNETAALLSRWLLTNNELESLLNAKENGLASRGARGREGMAQVRAQAEAEARQRERPLWWVLGTSLGFEAVVLVLAAWLFCRRDF